MLSVEVAEPLITLSGSFELSVSSARFPRFTYEALETENVEFKRQRSYASALKPAPPPPPPPPPPEESINETSVSALFAGGVPPLPTCETVRSSHVPLSTTAVIPYRPYLPESPLS